MKTVSQKIVYFSLHWASVILFAGVFLAFGLSSHVFLQFDNLLNILIQSSSVAIVAIGMTFVLLTAGIDLSVGAIMFLCAAIAGKLILQGYPLWLGLLAILATGALYGALNAWLISRLRIMAFIVTLATLYIGRGMALLITETRAMNLPENFLQIGSARIAGVPAPVLVFLVILGISHLILNHTAFGKHIYAVGNDLEGAQKAGIPTRRIIRSVYIISGICAAVGGFVSVAQLGAVSPTFGEQREFMAIAAAVLGGTSLFGGRGNVFPGTVLGAILIQSIENALVIMNADPYMYPLVTSLIIFLAVLVDSLRHGMLEQMMKRRIRIGE